MFWAGRVNSILVIVTFGGTFLIGILSSPLNGVAWFFFMLFVRIAIKLLDLFWTQSPATRSSTKPKSWPREKGRTNEGPSHHLAQYRRSLDVQQRGVVWRPARCGKCPSQASNPHYHDVR